MTIHGKKIRTKGKRISVADMLRSMDHLRWDHPDCITAFKIAAELQKWFNERCDDDNTPKVWLSIAHFGIAISINDTCVYDSESSSHEDMTVEHCKQEFKESLLKQLAAYDI